MCQTNSADCSSQKDSDRAAGRKQESVLEERHQPALESSLSEWMTLLFETGSLFIPLWQLFENNLKLVSEDPVLIVLHFMHIFVDDVPTGLRSLLILIE